MSSTNDPPAPPVPPEQGLADAGPTSDQPLTVAVEAAPPAVPPPGEHPAGFESITDRPKKFWRVGTLVYTSGALVVLFFWLLFGDFAYSMRERSVGSVATKMLSLWKTNNFTISILLSMVPVAISMVLSPVISYKSDRMRSRWGRRIPFLLIPTPIAAVSMIGLAFCPQLAAGLRHLTGDAMTEKASLLTVFAVFWTCFDFAVVVSGAVLGGLINDVVPRAVIGRFYALFRAVSLIDGMIFNWFILGHAQAHFTIIFIWIAIVFGVGFSLMCLMVKEGDYPAPPSAAADHRAGGFTAAVGVYFRECFSRPHFLLVFAAFTLAAMAANPVNWWSLLYAEKVNLVADKWSPNGIGFGEWRLGYGGIIALTYVFSLCLAYPVGILVDRFNTLRVGIAAMTLYAVSVGLGALFVHDAESFGWALLAHGVLSGTYFTASASMAQVLLPRERFSQFASAGALLTQMMTLGFAPFLGKLLDLTGSNYRITFMWSFAFATAAVLLLVYLSRQYAAMGGPDGYEAAIGDGPRGFEVVEPKTGR